MLTGYIRGQELRISTPEIAADSIKYLEAEFHFAGRDWDGYVKTAYFINGTSKFALVLADDRITADMGLNLTAGEWEVKLSGVKGGSRITTTTEHVYVREFGSTDGTLPDVTATQAEQILAQIGDLANLTTEDKTNLVAAINEAAKSGGGSGGGKDGTGIESITYKGEDEDGGNVYTVLLTDGTSYDITAPKGAKGDKGDKGDTGATGPQGPDGAPGKDGAGMDITGATVGQIAKITAVDSDGKPTAWSPVDMPSGGGGEWVKVAEATLAEVVNEIRLDFAPCKAVYFVLQYGAVENDLGVIGIYPNPKTPIVTQESRTAAITVTTSNANKRGYIFCTIDRRQGTQWVATSQAFSRGDGTFGSITPGSLMNCEIGVFNNNTWASIISAYYMVGNDYVNSVSAYGAGMSIGTTLQVWGIKA